MDVVFSRQFSSINTGAETFKSMGGGWSLNIPKIRTTRDYEPNSLGHQTSKTLKCGWLDSLAVKVDGKVLSSSVGQDSSGNLANNISDNAMLLTGNYILNGCNEMEVLTPDGRTIKFIKSSHNYRPGYSYHSGTYIVEQYYVSEIKDRFGNSINYYYDRVSFTSSTGRSYSNIPILKLIENSEGSKLSVDYIDVTTFPKVSQVNYNGKSIKYRYGGGVSGNLLQEVENAEGEITKYQWDVFSPVGKIETPVLKKVSLYSGAQVEYTYEIFSPGDPTICSYTLPCTPCYHDKTFSSCYIPVIKRQIISGVGLDTKTINYVRHHLQLASEVTKTINAPNIYKKNKYTFKRVVNNEGNGDSGLYSLNNQLLKVEVFDSKGKVYQKTNNWVYKKLGEVGCTRFAVTQELSCGQARLVKETEKLFFPDGVDSYFREFSNFNVYGIPEKTHEWNSFNEYEKYTVDYYSHSKKFWVLNKLTSSHVSNKDSNYKEVRRIAYYSDASDYKGLPQNIFSYGRLIKRYAKYLVRGSHKGVPQRIEFNDVNRWIEIDTYKRGKPQRFKRTTSKYTNQYQYSYRYMNDDGLVSSEQDFEGKVCNQYKYDKLNRLTDITPCSSEWDNTTITYGKTIGSDGVSYVQNGMLKQSITTGNLSLVNYYDSFYRKNVEQSLDKMDIGTRRYIRQSYDALNRMTLQSKASNSSTTPYKTNYQYDVLGRITLDDDNTLVGSISHKYHRENTHVITDNKGNITSQKYLAFGYPDASFPISISSPEGVTTKSKYNIFNNLVSVSQGGLTEHRVYDNHQQLCKVVRPDIGNKAMQYNKLGENEWLASGSSISNSLSECDFVVSDIDKVKYTYDYHGNIKTIDYGDTTPDKYMFYDKDNRLLNITAGLVTNSYKYNSAGLLEDEFVSLDGQSFRLSYGYDSLKNLNSIGYPNGEIITLAPNSFGQPTQAGNYATNVNYAANGTIKNFKYGNGFVHTTELRTSGMPKNIYDQKGNAIAIDHYLDFDANKNMTYLRDDQNRFYDLDLTYDGLDRLDTIRDSFMGAGHINYDTMSNITYYKIGNQAITYSYDSNKRLNGTNGSYAYDFTYDSRGNVKNNGRQNFTYNLAQHTTSSSKSGKNLSFIYDGQDKRVAKTLNGKKSYFIYGHNGKLLHKVKANGVQINQIYLGNRPVAENIIGSSSPETGPPQPINALRMGNTHIPLYNSEQTEIWVSLNLDNDYIITISWDPLLSGENLYLEYRIDLGASGNGTWQQYSTYTNTTSGDLNLISEGLVPKYSHETVIEYDLKLTDYKKLFLRVRIENDSGNSAWRYIKPIWIYNRD